MGSLEDEIKMLIDQIVGDPRFREVMYPIVADKLEAFNRACDEEWQSLLDAKDAAWLASLKSHEKTIGILTAVEARLEKAERYLQSRTLLCCGCEPNPCSDCQRDRAFLAGKEKSDG